MLRVCLKLVGKSGESEIGNAHATAAVEHYVGRFEIAVQDVVLVGGGQTQTKLPRDFDRLVLGRRAQASQHVGQVVAVHVLHRKKNVFVDLCDVVNATNVGVSDLTRGAYFTANTVQRHRVCGESLRQELQRHGLAQF